MRTLLFSGFLAIGLIFYGCNGNKDDTDAETDADTDADADADSDADTDTGQKQNGPQLQFGSDFVTEYCNAWANCMTTICDVGGTVATDTGLSCNFDQTAADACTNGTFICDANAGTVIPPTECANVCP
jgi:hypothetical protein